MIGFIVLIGIAWEYHVNISAVYHWNKEHIMKLKAETMNFGYLISIGSGLLGVSFRLVIDPCGPGWDLLHHMRTISDWTILEIYMGVDQNLL